MPELDPKTTALVLIDFQKGIMGHALSPHSADQVTKVGSALADTFREAGAPVVLVNVGFAKDFKDALQQPVDQPFAAPPGDLPENFSELIDGLAKPGDILVTKRQWGAFHGTELDLQLRRRAPCRSRQCAVSLVGRTAACYINYTV
jgi:nicotinamidase-related amidase